jgi:ketosteroid isomerase-like protein
MARVSSCKTSTPDKRGARGVACAQINREVFEDTSPAPDGQRIEGKAAVVAFWRAWFARNADAVFETEDVIVSGDRAVVRWVYRKLRNGQPWHLRSVDVFTVRDGKVAAKLATSKGEVATTSRSSASGPAMVRIPGRGSLRQAVELAQAISASSQTFGR